MMQKGSTRLIQRGGIYGDDVAIVQHRQLSHGKNSHVVYLMGSAWGIAQIGRNHYLGSLSHTMDKHLRKNTSTTTTDDKIKTYSFEKSNPIRRIHQILPL